MTYAPSKIDRDDDFSSLVLHLHEVVRTDEPEDHSHKKREPSPRGVMHDGWSDIVIREETSSGYPSRDRQNPKL
jgi:hypothetical protein